MPTYGKILKISERYFLLRTTQPNPKLLFLFGISGIDAINFRSELYLMKMMVNIQMAERAIGVTEVEYSGAFEIVTLMTFSREPDPAVPLAVVLPGGLWPGRRRQGRSSGRTMTLT